MSLRIKGRIIGVAEQLRNGTEPLVAREHSRLGDGAGSFLADDGRGIVMHRGEQHWKRLIASYERETFYCPMARVFVGVFQVRG